MMGDKGTRHTTIVASPSPCVKEARLGLHWPEVNGQMRRPCERRFGRQAPLPRPFGGGLPAAFGGQAWLARIGEISAPIAGPLVSNV